MTQQVPRVFAQNSCIEADDSLEADASFEADASQADANLEAPVESLSKRGLNILKKKSDRRRTKMPGKTF